MPFDGTRLREWTAEIENRIGRLEAKEAGDLSGVSAAPAAKSNTPQDKPKDFWDKLKVLSPLMTPVVLLLLGYWLNDSINQALRRQELQLSNVREMRQLLTDLQGNEVTPAGADGIAGTLSAFGAPSVGPLVSILSYGDEIRSPAAVKALRAVGLTAPEAVCGPLIKVVDNRSGRFNWRTHMDALTLIGDLECRNARPALRRFGILLEQMKTPEQYPTARQAMDQSLELDKTAIKQLESSLERAVAIIGR